MGARPAALAFDQAVRAVSLRLTLDGAATGEVLSSRLQHDNASIAGAAVFGPWGVHMFTTLEGNRQIAMSLPDNDAEIARFNVGRAPQGIALSPDGTELAVHNFMDRTVQFIDLRDAASGASLEVDNIATVATVSSEGLAPDVLIGKQLFYDAHDDRLAALDYMSCASCHEDGGHDGRVWDFSQFGEGVRNTTSLRGKAGMGHGLMHWTGNLDEVQDFEGQIREFAGGVGLMTDANFFAGTRDEPLGDPKAGFSSDLDALAAYLASLDQADGSAATLQEAISRHSTAALNAGQLDDLAAFLLEQPGAPAGNTAVLDRAATEADLFGTMALLAGAVGSPNGTGFSSFPNEADRAEFRYVVTEPGLYQFEGEVRAPNGNDDSFWVRVDDGPHTVRIYQCEDGTFLRRLRLVAAP